jgi:tRNA (mo5U34)-methyltransferase
MLFGRKQKSRAEIEEEIRKLGWWYQYFRLPGGAWTGSGAQPSYQPEERWELIEPFVPKDLSGQTVLDVGGNAGYFSVQMKRRGAKHCVLVEPYVEFARQARFVAEAFNVKIDVRCEDIHTYCLTTDKRFDYVLFLGLFYHLKYPVLVLDRLAEMTKQRMYFQCHLLEPDKDNQDFQFPQLSFIEEVYNGDPTNWWIPGYSALEPLLRSAGLKVVSRPHGEILVAEPEEYFGKVTYRKLVFPRYGKRSGARFPGRQSVDPALWNELLAKRDNKDRKV